MIFSWIGSLFLFLTHPFPADTIDTRPLLFNGPEYGKVFNSASGTPFFDANAVIGDVKYQGNWFRNIELRYDIEDDVVLTRDSKGQLRLQLVKEKLDEFLIGDRRFIRMVLTSPQGEFYEQLFRGKRVLLVEWRKALQTDVRDAQKYVLRKRILVVDNGKVQELGGLSDFYSLAPGHEKEIRRIYNGYQLNFRRDPVKASTMMLTEIEKNKW